MEHNHSAPAGLYIHVPFCAGKCPYCDFYSLCPDEDILERYTRAVCDELAREPYANLTCDTVYFGGGTPPLLGAERLDRILNAAVSRFHVPPDAEITLEANPSQALESLLPALRRSGFNRVSLGVQSAVDGELSVLGRKHSARQALEAIEAARTSGFSNISADLMLGIPGQTKDSLSHSISALSALPLTHISAYLLKIEPGTPFAASGTAEQCPDEDLTASLYLQCVRQLADAGYIQYEISNFAKPGRESRHNLKYWLCEDYLGVGPSAHSFLNGRRFYCEPDVSAFIKNAPAVMVDDGGGGDFEEYAMLRLRLTQGLDLAEAERRFGADTRPIRKRAAGMGGFVAVENDRIFLTPDGFLLSNHITATLLYGTAH